ncbi:MAG: DUF2927 domain-containing protein [Pseudomonadota bacterium]
MRWLSAPRVVAFVRTDAERRSIAEKLAEIEHLAGFSFAPGLRIDRQIQEIRFVDASELAAPDAPLGVRVDRLDADERVILLSVGAGEQLRIYAADIVLVIADSAGHARLAAARRPVRRAFWDGIGRGEIPCFFEAARPRGLPTLDYAFVLLNPEGPLYDLEGCVHEELFQAMGLPRDAVGSPFFSFDNLPIAKDTRLDRLLLRALYAPEGRPGEPVLEVIKRFDALRRSEPR